MNNQIKRYDMFPRQAAADPSDSATRDTLKQRKSDAIEQRKAEVAALEPSLAKAESDHDISLSGLPIGVFFGVEEEGSTILQRMVTEGLLPTEQVTSFQPAEHRADPRTQATTNG